jgi:hypothetical protein
MKMAIKLSVRSAAQQCACCAVLCFVMSTQVEYILDEDGNHVISEECCSTDGVRAVLCCVQLPPLPSPPKLQCRWSAY